MEAEMDGKLICQVRRKEFSCTSTRNRHIRYFPGEVSQPIRKKQIMCPNELRNLEHFTVWKAMENREIGYACDIKRKNSNGEEDILYNCNRSDSRGFVFPSKKRSMKTGGSIRIHGMCPSRIKAKISKDGTN